MSKLRKTNSPGFKGNRTMQSLDCKYCGEEVHNVDINATAITCYKCVSKMCSGVPLPNPREKKSDK